MESRYTAEQLAAIRSQYAPEATDVQFTNFIRECEERKLIPGRQVYFQLRVSSVYDGETGAWIRQKRPVHLTSIDAFRLIAQRTGEYEGQEGPEYIYLDDNGEPSIRSVVPKKRTDKDAPVIPWAAEVRVYRKNFQKPLAAVGRYDAYAVKKRDGTPTEMWERRGPEQLGKCVEALALRKAFPEELGSIYIEEEFPNETPNETETPAEPQGKSEGLSVEEIAKRVGGKIVSVKPSRKDRAEYVKRARVFSRKVLPEAGMPNAEPALKAYILKKANVSDTEDITTDSWEAILGTLDNLLAMGGCGAVAEEIRKAA